VVIAMDSEQQAKWAAIRQQSAELLNPKSEPAPPLPPADAEPLTYEAVDAQMLGIDKLLAEYEQKREAKTVDRLVSIVHQMFAEERTAERGLLFEIFAEHLAEFRCEMKAFIIEQVGQLRAELTVRKSIEDQKAIDDDGDDDGNVTPFVTKKVVQ
jgi:hypothetical protein